ncbi:MAG: serine/threonine-protein kinase [Candidatus Muiribacteriota bacterium]
MKIIGLVLKQKYQILQRIGENERFYTFRGINIKNESPVFIKVVKQSLLKDKKKIKFFTEEVKSLAKIKHENVVKVYDVDFKNGILYVVTEYIEGKSLYQYISQKKKFDFWQVIQIVNQLASVLKYAFDKGVKYRTVKHSNIIITDDMKVKILSFNVPRSILSPLPVKIKENEGIDPDIFFLGVVLYELFTLKFPLRDKDLPVTDISMLDENLLDTRWNITFADIESPEKKEGIEKVIYHSVTRNILDRYKSIEEFLDDLKQYIEKKDRKEKTMKTASDVTNELGVNEYVFNKRFNGKNKNYSKKTKEDKIFNIPEEEPGVLRKQIIFLVSAFSVILALIYFIYTLLF